jgi:hypothetical protein
MVGQCKKGDTIASFLDKARQGFPEIKKVSVDNLLYVVGLARCHVCLTSCRGRRTS